MAEDRTVRITCRRCGPVVASPSEIGVTGGDSGGLFAFTCPSCGRDVWQAADAGTLAVLRSVGAPEVTGVAPLELVEPHAGPPITWDDLLEAHQVMSGHCCPQDELSV